MGDLSRDSSGAANGRIHPRRIGRSQHRDAHRGYADFPIDDVELRGERRPAKPAVVSDGCELRVGVGSDEWGGRVRRHPGIGGRDSVGGS